MSAGTLTVHNLLDVLIGLEALALQDTSDTSTTYVDDLVSPAVRIVFQHDPAVAGTASSFVIEGPDGTPLHAVSDYGVPLDAFGALVAAQDVEAALALLLLDLGTLALAGDAGASLVSLKDGLVMEGNDEGTGFEVAHAATTVNAGGGNDTIILRKTSNGGHFDGGEGEGDILWLDTSLGAVNVSLFDFSLTVVVGYWDFYWQSFQDIEFFRGSMGSENFTGIGNGARFEGNAGSDQFFLGVGSPTLVDVATYANEDGSKGVVVNLGFDPVDTSSMDDALEAALTTILEGDAAPGNGLVRDTSGALDNMSTGFVVEGSKWADFFYGSGVDDAFLGGGGADHFFGGDGNDRFDGGADEDTFYLGGAFSAYLITHDAVEDAFTIAANDGSGTDTITGVERVSFAGDVRTAAQLKPVVDSPPVASDDGNDGDAVVEAGGGDGDEVAEGNVLGNDADADDDPITVTGIRADGEDTFEPVGTFVEVNGIYGTLTIAPDGFWTYALDNGRPATNALGAGMIVFDTFTYQIDAGGKTDDAVLRIAIEGRNDAPVASADSLRTDEDTPLTISAATLTGDDDDADGDILAVASVRSEVGGVATLNAGGTISFTPAADFSGQARFSYRAVDSKGALSAPALATVTVVPVNDAPRFTAVGPLAVPAIVENTTFVAALSVLDIDSTALTLSLGGADAARFGIEGSTLLFMAAPDFEAPADGDRNNAYQVTVTVSDGALSETRNLTVLVLDAAGNVVVGTRRADRIDADHAKGGKAATSEEDVIDGKGGKDKLAGAAGNDVLFGGKGDDRLKGEAGDDVLQGGAGKDRLDGGEGRDTADYSDTGKSVSVALDGAVKVRARVGGAADDTLKNMENVAGGKRADQLTGDRSANMLVGNGGNDVLAGSLGADTLSGGAGRDRFVFDTKLKASNIDMILDFAHNRDRIALDAGVFKAIGARLDAREFRVGEGTAAALDRNDRIVYDALTGALYYDRDGNRSGAAPIQFATLIGDPAVDAGDFLIV